MILSEPSVKHILVFSYLCKFVLFEKHHSWSRLALIHGLGYSRDGSREATREQRGANADWTAKDKHVSHAHGICTHHVVQYARDPLYATCSLALCISSGVSRVSAWASTSPSRSGYPSFCVASNQLPVMTLLLVTKCLSLSRLPPFYFTSLQWYVFVILSLIHFTTALRSLLIVVAR
jgi:hypothetical protein